MEWLKESKTNRSKCNNRCDNIKANITKINVTTIDQIRLYLFEHREKRFHLLCLLVNCQTYVTIFPISTTTSDMQPINKLYLNRKI